MFEGTSVPQEERRAQGSLCKPAWLGFYPFLANTSRYCLDEGKVELRAVLARGEWSLIQAENPAGVYGEDPSVTLAVRDGKHPSEILQE